MKLSVPIRDFVSSLLDDVLGGVRFRAASDEFEIRLTTHDESAETFSVPTDPLFNVQWHLNDPDGINVQAVWDEYTGQAITIGFVDDGVEYTHPELDDNYNYSIDYDSQTGAPDGAHQNSSDRHGTTTSGVAGGEANNGLGISGVAYNAEISSYRLNFNASITDSQLATVFNRQATDVDISNNSWGSTSFFGDDFDLLTQTGDAIENAATNGRGGLGTVVVFSAGNGRTAGDDVNMHNFQNSKYTIAVGATDDAGNYTYFSNHGASLLTSAPGLGIVTTDRQGNEGYVSGDYASASGTSYSAPIISGVVALMLEANPNLGVRDVQEILAHASRKTGEGTTTWQDNAAENANGGGMHFSHDYGFGLIDAFTAVRLAETWQQTSTFSNEDVVNGGTSSPNVLIRTGGNGTSDTINVSSAIDINHVEIDLNITHSQIGELVITLTSPDGTSSTLINRPGVNPDGGTGRGSTRDDIDFTLTSNAFWGEQGDGVWTITVQDLWFGSSGRLKDWSLRLYGDDDNGNNTYIYTNEFADYAGDASRTLLTDSGGDDTINAAAMSGDTTLNLSGGASNLGGTAMSITNGTTIEHAYTGDGNDAVTGNDENNMIHAGRGNDTVEGGAGNDTLIGGDGDNVVNYLGAFSDFVFNILSSTTVDVMDNNIVDGDEGNDIVSDFTTFFFGGIEYNFDGTNFNQAGAGNTPPVVDNSIPDDTATEGSSYNFVFAANTFSDADGDTLSYSATQADNTALPSWLNFNPDTRTFFGIPTDADTGVLSVKVTASDGNGGNVSDVFDIDVADINNDPTLDNLIPDDTATEGSPYNFTFASNTFSDLDAGDTLSYSAKKSDGTALPTWLNFNPATRTFSGTPSVADVGVLSVMVIADDGNGGVPASDIFDIVVSVQPNNSPAADDDSDTTQQDTAVIINVLSNDDDPDGDPITVDNITIGPNNGATVINADNTITYTPNPGWSGIDSFTYEISDDKGAKDTAEVTVTVEPAPQPEPQPEPQPQPQPQPDPGPGDNIEGSRADELINGTAGHDTIDGARGDDTINGLGGNDILLGNRGSDEINGGDGDDSIDGGRGIDLLRGGAGNDTILADRGSENTIYGGEGIDLLVASKFGGSDDFLIFETITEGGDVINNFRTNEDVLDFRTMFNSIGYTGSDAVLDSYMRFQADTVADQLHIFVDQDGAGGAFSEILYVTLDQTNITSLALGSDYLV